MIARAECSRCRRPEVVCYCAHLTTIPTTTRVVLLQHPRERDRAIGTAHMASLCLPGSELHVGARWGEEELARILRDSTQPAVLLYPGEGAVDIVAHPPPGPVTLVVVDGTWSQTKNVLRDNPALAALPRVAFTPPAPSEYRIRKEPRAECVSTIEALVHVLGALERDPERFDAMLAPFRAMIDMQIACERTFHRGRVRKKRRAAPKSDRERLPARLVERKDDLVCVVGEANAWPYHTSGRSEYRDELVQWTARRVATGETFEFVAAPRNPLAPSTPMHTRLAPERILAGGSMNQLFARWRAFVRDGDVVCGWGHYATALFRAEGGELPEAPLDLRHAARELVGGKVGTLEEFAERIDVRPVACGVPGRAGDRLARLVGIAERFRTIAACGALLVACAEPAPPPPSIPSAAPSTPAPAVVVVDASPPPPPPPVVVVDASAPEIVDAGTPDVIEAAAPEPTFTPLAGAATQTTFKWATDVRRIAITNVGTAGPTIRDAAAKVRGRILQRATQCFRRGLDADPYMAGKITFTITVRPDGAVDGTPTVQASTLPQPMSWCIPASVRSVEFTPSGATESSMIRLSVELFRP